jgi:uncharacterized protein YbjT (DUF2867 family)
MTILVTGGTGTLGRELVPLLRSRDADVAVLSRRAHPAFRTGDLGTGAGVEAALDGIDTVVHLAAGGDQAREADTLTAAMRTAGVERLVFISIAGIDAIPFPYYRAKLAAEQIVLSSPLDTRVLRTTQFHSFVAAPFLAQRGWPVVLAPRLGVQPIDVRVVAERLAELTTDDSPATRYGRVPDLGGPQVLTGGEIAEIVDARLGLRRRIVQFGLPGSAWAAFAQGSHLVHDNPSGGRSFAQYLADATIET